MSTIKIMQIYKSHQHLTSIFCFLLDYNVFEGIDGLRGVYCSCKACRRMPSGTKLMQWWVRGESIKKLPARWTCRQFLTLIFCLSLVDDVFEGIGEWEGVYCGREARGGCPRVRTNIREEKVSQLQKVTIQMNLPTISHLQSSFPTRRRCIRGDTAVEWGGRLAWGG